MYTNDVSEDVHDGGSTKKRVKFGTGCVCVFQGMGDEVAVLAVVVIDAAVSMLFVCR